MRPRCICCLAAALLTGCGEAALSDDPFARPAVCTSGVTRSPNASESPEMAPGRACIACHADSNAMSGEGDAPIFAFAGTVYPSAHEPDDCAASAAEGAEIRITDAKGRVFVQLANAVGNFSDESGNFAYPYTAVIRYRGREREMLDKQMTGDCNGCHTQNGAMSAPGRLLLP